MMSVFRMLKRATEDDFMQQALKKLDERESAHPTVFSNFEGMKKQLQESLDVFNKFERRLENIDCRLKEIEQFLDPDTKLTQMGLQIFGDNSKLSFNYTGVFPVRDEHRAQVRDLLKAEEKILLKERDELEKEIRCYMDNITN